MNIGDLSTATIEYKRLTRVLRGSAAIRIEDIGRISRVMPEAFAAGIAAMVRLVTAPTRHG
jgi:hypothetical protein